ncbi:hypothetical protein [Ruegeria arenilitoris]|uniref:hypothetical protein n=1 Tax=Ruegeria arenilitoris TaxID=1173585 RepID=UPI00147FC247|nr:hypothetical protein [Ruegeria arenilitoris]
MISWLSSLDAKVLQGLLTLAAAASASITALVVAFFAYPWQRQRDHEFELRREQRTSYREFLGVMNRLFTAIIRQDDEEASREQMHLHQVASEFLCFSSKESAVAARDYINAVQKYRKATFQKSKLKQNDADTWRKERRQAREDCVIARRKMLCKMRADLTGEDASFSEGIMRAHFPTETGLET